MTNGQILALIGGIWLVIMYLLWSLRRSPEPGSGQVDLGRTSPPAQPRTVHCDRCQQDVPRWFAEVFGHETICFADAEHKPYPHPGENEDAYVERWLSTRTRDEA